MFRISAIIALCVPFGLHAETPLKILFLGDEAGHHRPAVRFRQLQPVMAKRGIEMTYTPRADSLKPEILAKYDGLVIYANIDEITPAQESALLEFVASGKGFIPLHCASYCFRNSTKFVALVGAQFQRHGTGTFRTTIANPEHPILKGFRGFESWDETYVHTKHNETDRIVLETRAEGNGKEPWTWVRTHGKGRVFYTAWGHDERTWGHPGFQNLVERGIRWACGRDLNAVPTFVDRPEMTPLTKDVQPFEYEPAKIPFYPAGKNWGTTAEPLSKMQKPLASVESIKHISTPTEFEVRLFVDETKLGGKPLCFAWDHRGRLWVALTMDYPNEMQPEGQGRDRIVICEDTDGDGVCDVVRPFADRLSIPTSLLPVTDGVIVTQAPHTLFLKDVDGDDRADLRQILFTGWGTRDTHAGPSNLRYGFDHWIYGMVGYSGFVGTVGDDRLSFRQGFFRFQIDVKEEKVEVTGTKKGEKTSATTLVPKVRKLEFLRSTNNNCWGVGFSEDGLLFGSTANGCPTVFLPMPNRYYETVRGLAPTVLANIAPDNHFEPITEKVRQVDWHGGFTAAAGHSLYTARTYPKEYWNRTAFVCEPTGHLAATFVLRPDGANFRARYGWNLLAADDEWCAPIAAEVGPDGNMWILDWYNFIVQHNPTPPGFRTGDGNAYVTPLRDRKHGRIYRLVAKASKPESAVSLSTPGELVAALKHHNMTWRLHAQRLLIERGQTDVTSSLLALVADRSMDDVGLNPGAIHALWTLHGLGVLEANPEAVKAALAALGHPSPAVRRAALLVLPRRDDVVKAWPAGIFSDPEPQVRLAALMALSELPASSVGAAQAACCLLEADSLADPILSDATVVAAAAHDRHLLILLATRRSPASPAVRKIVESVARHYAGGTSRQLNDILIALATGPSGDLFESIVAGLAAGWPTSKSADLSEEAQAALTKLFTHGPTSTRPRLLRLASLWGVKGLASQLTAIQAQLLKAIQDPKSDDPTRIESAQQLLAFKPADDETALAVLASIEPRTPPALSSSLFEALGASTSPALGAELTRRLLEFPPSARAAAVRLLLSRAEWTKDLLDAVEKGTATLDLLALDQKVALSSHADKALAARAKALLAKGGGLPDPDRQKVLESLLSLTKKTGSAEAGKAIFKATCAKCHRHSGEGEQIGPDLTGMAVHTKEHLLTDIIDPSRNVEGNFRIYRVEMKDGRTFSGILSAETKTTLELIDAEAKRHTLVRDNIEELQASTKSLMPEGFEKQIKPDDLVNLLEFLTLKGKYVPIPLDKAATIVTTRGMFNSETAEVERLIFADWAPKTFKGVPFVLVDPRGDRIPNAVMLNGSMGQIPPKMPKSVMLPCQTVAKTLHFLSGISGWGYSATPRGTTSMIVRLHYEDGETEDHALKNGIHFADYIRKVDVPESEYAFALRSQQLRYLTVTPKRPMLIKQIELVKGPDRTAPVVMAVTIETP